MYPTEAVIYGLTTEELEVIKSVRFLIGDLKKSVIEEVPAGSNCANILMDSSVYKMEDKGWPKKIVVSGVEVTNPYDPYVDNYEFLVFSGTGVLDDGITIMYDTFRFGDIEILESYDYGSASVLVGQCSLTAEQLTTPLLNLAAAVVLVQGEFQRYADEAVKMQDNDSLIDLTDRLEYLQKELSSLRDMLQQSIRDKLCCATYTLPVIRIE